MAIQNSRKTHILVFLILFPVLLHSVGIAISLYTEGQSLFFGKLDLLAYFSVILYLAIAVSVIRNTTYTFRFLAFTYSTLLTLGMIEFVAPLIDPTIGPAPVPWEPGLTRISKASGTMPGIDGEIVFSINSLGLRGPEMQSAKHRILCVGGSTTECLYVTDKKSWPWLLSTKLSHQLREPVYVGNAGKSGHFTLSHAYLLQHYAHIGQFNWVVILCGINDAGTLYRNNYEERAKQVSVKTLNESRRGFYYRNTTIGFQLSRIARTILRKNYEIVQDPVGEYIAKEQDARKKLLAQGMIRVNRRMPPLWPALGRYRENLTMIINICRRQGRNLLFLTQPTIYQADMPKELEDLVIKHSNHPEILEKVISEYNRVLVEVCETHGIDYVDLASALPKDTTVFYDDAHFNTSGCEQVASILTAYFLNKIQ